MGRTDIWGKAKGAIGCSVARVTIFEIKNKDLKCFLLENFSDLTVMDSLPGQKSEENQSQMKEGVGRSSGSVLELD